jgi:hypothetical protein
MFEVNAEVIMTQMAAMIRLAIAIDLRKSTREEDQRESCERVTNTLTVASEKQHTIKNSKYKGSPVAKHFSHGTFLCANHPAIVLAQFSDEVNSRQLADYAEPSANIPSPTPIVIEFLDAGAVDVIVELLEKSVANHCLLVFQLAQPFHLLLHSGRQIFSLAILEVLHERLNISFVFLRIWKEWR